MRIRKLIIEGMHKVSKQEITFDQLNYIYGPNGVGKSTILQAIQLALLGYIPGQSKASKEAIFRHSNGRTIAVTLELEDDANVVNVSRVWTKVGSSINSAVTVEPNVIELDKILGSLELPVFNFNEFINMTANKLKDWFIDFLPKDDTKIDLWAEMQSVVKASGIDLTDRFKEFITAYADTSAGIKDMTAVTVEDIRKFNAALKSLSTVKKSEQTRAQGAIQSLIHYEDFQELYSPSEFEAKLKYATDGLVAQKGFESQKTLFETNMNKLAAHKASLDELNRNFSLAEDADHDPEIVEYMSKLNYYVDKYRKYEEDLSSIEDKLKALAVDIKFNKNVVEGGDVCPFTKTTCESIKASVDAASAKLAELKEEYSSLDKLRSKDVSDMSAILAKQNTIQNDISKKRHMYITRNELESQIYFITQQTATIAPPEDSRPVSEWEQMVKELQDYQVKSEANKRYNELIDTLTANKFEVDTEIECIKLWDKLTGVNGLQSNSEGYNPFDTFASKLNNYIPILFGKDCWADFNITNKANSFNFGINRGATYIPFDLLSSGEKCMYTLALMTCLTAESDAALKLVLVDDMFDHLDDTNVEELFKALSQVPDIQMIFAGVRKAEFGKAIAVESL